MISWPAGVTAEHLLAFLAAFAVAALGSWVMRAVAPRIDLVSRPRGERWSSAPTPMGGGVAIWLALTLGLQSLGWDLLLAATLVFVLGLVDDKKNLSPPAKLVVQLVAACWVVAAPLGGDSPRLLAGPELVVVPLTIAWFVGMANSVNLLDNMDGSAAGVSAVAGLFIYALAAGDPAPDLALGAAAAVTVGACLGFLVHNFPPARIYMGDAGSLLLGFSLAGLATHLPRGEGAAWRNMAVPLAVLGAPLFDTALVWVTRRAARRPFLQGGRDHTTHRLMALGLSPRRTLLVIYGAAAALGGLALALARGGLGTAVLTLVLGGALAVLLGVFLGDVPVYPSAEGQVQPAHARRPALLYGVELAVDGLVLTAAWVGAYALRFGGSGQDLSFYLGASALPALPFVLAFKISALLWFDLYRGFWRTIRLADVLSIGKAISLGTLLVVVSATLLVRFEDYSRGVIAIDWLLSVVGVTASRSAQRVLRDSLARLIGRPLRAALIGPDALRPLVEPLLRRDYGYELVAVVPLEESPEALIAALAGVQAEVALVGAALGEDDPRLAALRRRGLHVRRVTAVLE